MLIEMKTLWNKGSKESSIGKNTIFLTACLIIYFFSTNTYGQPTYNVSASSGQINISVPDNSLSGARKNLTLSGAGGATIDASSVISATVSVNTNNNGDVDMYLVGPSNCGTLELSTDNGSSGHNYAGATLITPSGAVNINTLINPTNNISGMWEAEGSYLSSSAQTLLFDFDNAPLHSPLPINLSVSGVTAYFSATGQGYSIQEANTMGFTPPGFSGRCIYPSSIFLADLIVSFDHTITDFSILYACQELGCDDAATMRVTAKMNGNFVGTNTRTATYPGTWPVDTLSCSFSQGFNSVVIHYDHRPPTCQDYGVIFMADDMRVTALNNPSALASGTGGGSYALPVTAISGCPVDGTWSLFVGDDAAGNSTSITSFDLNINNNVSAILNLNIILEGLYDGGGQMRPLLYMAGLNSDPTATDSITVELNDEIAPYSTFTSAKALLQTNGSAQVQFPYSVLNNSYYIVIKHRNTITTWSASPVNFNTSSINFDFTSSQTQAYGSNMIETSDQRGWAFYSGDIYDPILGVGFQDGIIDYQDYFDMEYAVITFLPGYIVEDLTGDGIVESSDYSLIENNVSNSIISIHP